MITPQKAIQIISDINLTVECQSYSCINCYGIVHLKNIDCNYCVFAFAPMGPVVEDGVKTRSGDALVLLNDVARHTTCNGICPSCPLYHHGECYLVRVMHTYNKNILDLV
jgi:hypothetical protein